MFNRLLKRALLFLAFYHVIIVGFGQPFINDIARFRENDFVNPPPKGAILFMGSSSFALWQDIHNYFPGYNIINRGFGGSTLEDQVRYLDDIVFPYAPRQIVIYCGENDFAASQKITPQVVTGRFIVLFQLIRANLPCVNIVYISMKPSLRRWHLASKFQEANGRIRKYINSQPNACFIDIWDEMLDHNSLPNPSLFLEDGLHMNDKGYDIWQRAITPHLMKPGEA